MKPLTLITLLFSCLIYSQSFAQTPKQIEADLLKSFKKIEYWDERSASETTLKSADSLNQANTNFGEKLKYYTAKYPSTIHQEFNLLKNDGLRIVNSEDGLFRIYSWDTGGGGTMYEFANVFQYAVGEQIQSQLDTIKATDNYVYFYSNLFTLKTKSKTYYLAVYNGVYASLACGQGVQICSIDQGHLNTDVKLIKTGSGLHSRLYYEYIFDGQKRSFVWYGPLSQTISIPVVVQKGRLTNRRIQYKFTGQYFERIKT